MNTLLEISNKLINSVKTNFTRGIIHKIDWNQPIIEIRGSRGVGKTTLLLQKAKQLQKTGVKLIYISLDTPYFFNHSLFDFALEFSKYGGEYLFIDEIHRYPSKHKNSDWSLELKNIIDSIPELKIIYSGSSILHLFNGNGDLSRRKANYLLNGLSFKEYLEMNKVVTLNTLSVDEIVNNHTEIAQQYTENFKPLLHFNDYLKIGYYPFYKDNESIYFNQLQNVINLIIDTDIAYLTSISNNAKEQLKRLLGAISTTVPYTPNMKTLAQLIEITDQRTLLKYLQLLEEAQILHLVKSDAVGNKVIQKPEKILINNTNLMFALGMNNTDKGTQRETFFFNQLDFTNRIVYSKIADFKVNENYIFEIGGKNKGKKQLLGTENSFIVSDDIEIGFGQKIPLWLFGFLY